MQELAVRLDRPQEGMSGKSRPLGSSGALVAQVTLGTMTLGAPDSGFDEMGARS